MWILFINVYLVPAFGCLVGYIWQVTKEYKQELKERDSNPYYFPSLTVGRLMSYVIASLIPVLNIYLLFRDVLGHFFIGLGDVLEYMCSIPLVPKHNSKDQHTN